MEANMMNEFVDEIQDHNDNPDMVSEGQIRVKLHPNYSWTGHKSDSLYAIFNNEEEFFSAIHNVRPIQ